jgi:hypothetical protein
MVYFKTRDVAAIAIGAALWGVLNSIFSPIFFRMFGLPFLCDLIGFTVLTVAVWWIRKLGAITAIGLIATVINFTFNPTGTHFLGFTAASIMFDVMSRFAGYDNFFKKPIHTMIMAIAISTLSAAVAGLIIGVFFMAGPALALWGGVLGWAGLHAIGGVIGGGIGGLTVNMLVHRKVSTTTTAV